jgi:hypothetical protein
MSIRPNRERLRNDFILPTTRIFCLSLSLARLGQSQQCKLIGRGRKYEWLLSPHFSSQHLVISSPLSLTQSIPNLISHLSCCTSLCLFFISSSWFYCLFNSSWEDQHTQLVMGSLTYIPVIIIHLILILCSFGWTQVVNILKGSNVIYS